MDSNVFRSLFNNILRLRIRNIRKYAELHLFSSALNEKEYTTTFTDQQRSQFVLEFRDYLLDRIDPNDPKYQFIIDDLEQFPFPIQGGCDSAGLLCLDKNDKGLLSILRKLDGTVDADKLVNETQCSSKKGNSDPYEGALDPVSANQEKTALDAMIDGVLVQAEIKRIQSLLVDLKKTGYLLLQRHVELDQLKDQYIRSIEKELVRLSG